MFICREIRRRFILVYFQISFSFDPKNDYIFSFVQRKTGIVEYERIFRIIYILIQDIAARNHKDRWLR